MECIVELLNDFNDLEEKYMCIKSMFGGENNKDNVCFSSDYSIYFVIGKKCEILVHSANYQTRAIDLMYYLSEKISYFSALEVLDEQSGEDNIESYCLLVVNEVDGMVDGTVLVDQIKRVIMDYDLCTDIIDAKTFYEEQKNNILMWNQYRKVNLPRCFVFLKSLKKQLKLKDTDCIMIKTLENNSGITINASEDKVIMIGVNGESYDMPGEKFDELYQIVNPEASELHVSKISSSYEMQPKAIVQGLEEVNLLDFAEICQSRKTNTVYACMMSKNIKVFSTRISGTNQYYLGNGEQKPFYLTVDKESPTSVHIIDQDVFEKSYELVKL